VRSPLLNINNACQGCHPYPEKEIEFRVAAIQGRNFDLMQRAGSAIVEMLDAVKVSRAAGVTDAQLSEVQKLHRKAQWRLDFVAAENSMGFHAPQETARILGESIDYSRQAQLAAERLHAGVGEPVRKPPAPKP
jgi:nitrite reductase (cytochrome c-552)